MSLATIEKDARHLIRWAEMHEGAFWRRVDILWNARRAIEECHNRLYTVAERRESAARYLTRAQNMAQENR